MTAELTLEKEYLRNKNVSALVAIAKAEGMNLKQALEKLQQGQKAKATHRRAVVRGIVQAKQDKSRAQLVQAEANAERSPMWLPVVIVIGVVGLIYAAYKFFTK